MRRIKPLFLIPVLAAILVMFSGFRGPTLRFDHQKHINSVGEDCTICHDPKAEDLLPRMATCAECHDEAYPESRPRNCSMCHLDKKHRVRFARDFLRQEWENVRPNFIAGHPNHATEKGGDCKVCHAKIATSTAPSTANYPTRETCGQCHQVHTGDPYTCAKCHHE